MVKITLAITLFYNWVAELIDIEAAFLEGRLKIKTFITPPRGLVRLGFMTQEEYDNYCIELQGGMYRNVDSALSYFGRFTEYATKKDGLNLKQSLSDPCVFYRKNEVGRTLVIVVVYVDDCLITGEPEYVAEIKASLKREFGTVEDGKLKKL